MRFHNSKKMLCFQLLGALFIPLLHGQLDFFNGIYFAFICLTAIEYGDLVPDKCVNNSSRTHSSSEKRASKWRSYLRLV